jgi:hypothetical protein
MAAGRPVVVAVVVVVAAALAPSVLARAERVVARGAVLVLRS